MLTHGLSDRAHDPHAEERQPSAARRSHRCGRSVPPGIHVNQLPQKFIQKNPPKSFITSNPSSRFEKKTRLPKHRAEYWLLFKTFVHLLIPFSPHLRGSHQLVGCIGRVACSLLLSYKPLSLPFSIRDCRREDRPNGAHADNPGYAPFDRHQRKRQRVRKEPE